MKNGGRPWLGPDRTTALKLALGPFNVLAGYVSREIWCTFEALRAHGWRLQESFHFDFAREGELPAYLAARLGEMPEVVLIWESYWHAVRHIRSLQGAGARVCVMTDDLHWSDRDGMREALRLADGILTPYAPVFGDFFPDVDASKVRWVPHAANPDFLLPLNDTPEPVVFVSGAINDAYPLRVAMRELARRRPEIARMHEHPGYGLNFNFATDRRR